MSYNGTSNQLSGYGSMSDASDGNDRSSGFQVISYIAGIPLHDFTMSSMKALTGSFEMGVANYNGLTNVYLSGYFGTTLFPGIYLNTIDIVIENKKNERDLK